MSPKDKNEFSDSVAALKNEIDILTSVNAIAINTNININLWQNEREQLCKSIRGFTERVYRSLDSLLDDQINIVRKLSKITDLKDGINNKRTEVYTTIRYLPMIKKYITVTGHYSEPLIEALCQLCNLYRDLFMSEFNDQSEPQKLDSIKQYLTKAPVRLFKNIDDAYAPAEDLIAEQTGKSYSKLLRSIDKMRTARITFFWLSIIPAIGVYILLSILWNNLNPKNFFLFIACFILAYISYVIVFDITIGICKHFIFRDRKQN